MMAFVFKFGLMKGQCQVKIGQNRSYFQIRNVLTKHAYLVYLFFRMPNMLYVFAYNYKCQKLHFQKVATSPLPVFCYHCTAKNKDDTLKFGVCVCARVCVVCMQRNSIYSGFWTIPKCEFI